MLYSFRRSYREIAIFFFGWGNYIFTICFAIKSILIIKIITYEDIPIEH